MDKVEKIDDCRLKQHVPQQRLKINTSIHIGFKREREREREGIVQLERYQTKNIVSIVHTPS
jgi:hypothetical protein